MPIWSPDPNMNCDQREQPQDITAIIDSIAAKVSVPNTAAGSWSFDQAWISIGSTVVVPCRPENGSE
jgi:hypothetical protein